MSTQCFRHFEACEKKICQKYKWKLLTAHGRALIWQNLSKRTMNIMMAQFHLSEVIAKVSNLAYQKCIVSNIFAKCNSNLSLQTHFLVLFIFTRHTWYEINLVWSKSKWNILDILLDLKTHLQLFPWSWWHRTWSIKDTRAPVQTVSKMVQAEEKKFLKLSLFKMCVYLVPCQSGINEELDSKRR